MGGRIDNLLHAVVLKPIYLYRKLIYSRVFVNNIILVQSFHLLKVLHS